MVKLLSVNDIVNRYLLIINLFFIVFIFLLNFNVFDKLSLEYFFYYLSEYNNYLKEDLLSSNITNIQKVFLYEFLYKVSFGSHPIFTIIISKYLIFLTIPITLFCISNYFLNGTSKNYFIIIFVITIIYFIFYKYVVLGWSSIRPSVSNHTIGFILISFAFLIEKKNKLIFYFLFISSFIFHPIISLSYFLYNYFHFVFLNNKFLSLNYLKSIFPKLFFSFLLLISVLFFNEDINLSAIKNIYLSRHEHHYIPSNYFDEYSIILILFLLALLIFNKFSHKKFLIAFIAFFSFINIFQYLLVEKLMLTPFVFLGISRLNSFIFFYVSVIFIIILDKKFKNNFNYFFFNKYLYILNIIIFIFTSIYFFQINLKAHKEFSDQKYLNFIKTNSELNSRFLILDHKNRPLLSSFIRVYSNRSIFFDTIFPFSNDHVISEWSVRHNLISDLNKRNNFDALCSDILKETDYFFIIDESWILDLDLPNLSFNNYYLISYRDVKTLYC